MPYAEGSDAKQNAGEAGGGGGSAASICARDESASQGKKMNEDSGDGGGVESGDGRASPIEKETNDTSTTAAAKQMKGELKAVKIRVHLSAVGSAPILKRKKFLMNADDRFSVAMEFLRRILKLGTGGAGATGAAVSSPLFMYVNQAFVPSPDERIGDLFDCFGVGEELQIHYSLQEAWG